MMYLGMEFKNAQEVKEWNKNGLIESYKKLAEMFDKKPSMELSVMMSDLFLTLTGRYGMTPDEVEALETEVFECC